MIYIQNDRYVGVPGYESWWDVPVAEVSERPAVAFGRDVRRLGFGGFVVFLAFTSYDEARSGGPAWSDVASGGSSVNSVRKRSRDG